jgi:hypothetical protein
VSWVVAPAGLSLVHRRGAIVSESARSWLELVSPALRPHRCHGLTVGAPGVWGDRRAYGQTYGVEVRCEACEITVVIVGYTT